MHVVLVGAEFEENLAVRYLRGALERAGHTVTTLVFNHADDTEACASALARSGAPLAGLSMVFTYRSREFARLATRARELGYRGHIVAGGHFAAFHPSELLRDVPAIDSVACGEGEPILCELAAALPELSSVAGLIWRLGDLSSSWSSNVQSSSSWSSNVQSSSSWSSNVQSSSSWSSNVDSSSTAQPIVRNAPALKPPDLGVLAYPPRKSPFDQYLGIPITNILSSRGCTRHCAFCSIAAWHQLCGGERLRLRAPGELADEMGLLFQQGVRIFNFHDDNFVLDDQAEMLQRMQQLRAELERRGMAGKIAFAIKSRPDVVARELFTLLRDMGMFRVFLGVEAGTAESLRRLGRGQTVGDNERALEVLNALDVHTCFNLLVLNPDSTLDDLGANVAFLRRHPRNPMNFCRTEIYAGTPLERRLRRDGRLLGDYWGYDYRIADPRAQLAFELIFPAFELRNYAEQGLHHLSMHLDYQAQLLGHFFGIGRALRRRVKSLLVEVNHNTCDHLDTVVAAVPRLGSAEARQAFGAELRQRVLGDDQRLDLAVRELLDEVHRTAVQPSERRVRRGWRRAAATAGLAATVTLAAAGCQDRSHATEMIAPPTGSAAGPPPKDAEPPATAPTDAGASASDAGVDNPATGPAALVKPEVSKQLLPLLGQKVVPPTRVELDLTVGPTGHVDKVVLLQPVLSADAEKAIVDRARTITFANPAVFGQHFVVVYSKEELQAAPAVPTATSPGTGTSHAREYIPRPEMAPRPEMIPRPEMAPRPNRNQ